ncbi:glycoside hydrolase family 16 protein [Allosphingosinicella flava]|uniref:Glycoside hydrolase family 16 protein n=2 Tax=Allosphingosinicella flava TaxID=2771430 RepID=A0A7T2GJF8_9SPHN|nr:glycoside hydrolase family 16 protein [Sphingosinicella flava]
MHREALYTLEWSDEFHGRDAPDPRIWTYDTEFNRTGWHNDERQYYARDRRKNARIDKSRLIIEAHREDLAPQDYDDWNGQPYSSARLTTRGRRHFQYGYFEVRAKLPCTVGTWPAIWLLPVEQDKGWPDDGEIDIAEHVGFDPGRVHHTLHTATMNHLRGTQRSAQSMVPDACRRFRRYQLLWTPDRIQMGVDDRITFRLSKSAAREWPFDKPYYLILNLAVGGSWGGREGIADVAFPARMEVDYVRYYRPARTGPAAGTVL